MSAGLVITARRAGKSCRLCCELALRVVDLARAAGFRSVGVQASRVPGSCSRYVVAVDALDRAWWVRVSDHPAPADNRLPHFDLVVQGGVADVGAVAIFLVRAVSFGEQWWDYDATGRKVSPRKRKLWGRR
jgi:hypothetical protein